jgi:uncharacterized protein (TIGR02722 family)
MHTYQHFRRPATVAALTGLLVLTSGCGTVSETRTVDAKGPEALNTAGINSQDWASAADQLVASLLSGNALARAPRTPAVLAIDRVVNDTSLMIDTDSLIKKVRVALMQTGKVVLTNTMGLGERAVVASEAAQLQQLQGGKKQRLDVPDYTLLAKISQQTDRSKAVTQNTYTFSMTLVETATGYSVWEETKSIAKQTGRPGAIGF